MKQYILTRTLTEKFTIYAKSLKEAKWMAAGNADINDPVWVKIIKETIKLDHRKSNTQ